MIIGFEKFTLRETEKLLLLSLLCNITSPLFHDRIYQNINIYYFVKKEWREINL